MWESCVDNFLHCQVFLIHILVYICLFIFFVIVYLKFEFYSSSFSFAFFYFLFFISFLIILLFHDKTMFSLYFLYGCGIHQHVLISVYRYTLFWMKNFNAHSKQCCNTNWHKKKWRNEIFSLNFFLFSQWNKL